MQFIRFAFALGLGLLPSLGCGDATGGTDAAEDTAADVLPDVPRDTAPDVPSMSNCATLEAGTLDPSFGDGDGYVLLDFGDGSRALGKALQIEDDGRFFVAFELLPAAGNGRFALARLSEDGALDRSFGGDGYSEIDVGPGDDVPQGMAVREGRGTVVGQSPGAALPTGAMVRFDPSGVADTGFGGTGTVLTNYSEVMGEGLGGAAFDISGRLLVAGAIAETGGMVVARYADDGTLDPTYGVGGVSTVINGLSNGSSVAADRNQALVAGTIAGRYAVARFDAAGVPDNTFNGDGVIDYGFDGHAAYILRDLLGRYVATGWEEAEGEAPRIVVSRAMPNGQPDPMFAGAGFAAHRISSEESRAYGVALDEGGGKLLIVGDAIRDGAEEMVLLRTLSDGTLDTGFADDGVFRIAFDGSDSSLRSVGVDADGRIVAAGWARRDGQTSLLVLRLCS